MLHTGGILMEKILCKKPVIGVTPLVDTEKESLWMLPGYMGGVAQAGGLPIMLPLTDDPQEIRQLAAMCDAFLFTGGHDVSPALYGEEPIPQCAETSPARDAMERLLLEEVLASDKPLLGICRGIQFLNAALGGTLYQDLPAQRPSQVNHHQTPPYDMPVHEVRIEKSSPLGELLQTERMSVNSYHHQAIKETAACLQVMARSTDGLTEAVCLPEKKFVWAVQWHPEFAYRTDDHCRKIFEAFVKSASL